MEQNVDYIALSFVKNVDDVMELKGAYPQKDKDIPIIAKIEKHEALNHLEEITQGRSRHYGGAGRFRDRDTFGRGAPRAKNIIRTANRYSKPVITATQMLGSMVNHYRPTRAGSNRRGQRHF